MRKFNRNNADGFVLSPLAGGGCPSATLAGMHWLLSVGWSLIFSMTDCSPEAAYVPGHHTHEVGDW